MDYPAARNAMKAHTMAECAVATGMLGGVHFTFVGAENKKSGTGKDYHLPPLDENGRVPAGAKYVAWPSNTDCPYYPGPLLNSDGTLNMVDTHPYFGGIQPEDADNVEKYPIECIQCFLEYLIHRLILHVDQMWLKNLMIV